MSGLEVLVALAGLGVTLLVVAAMILITPRGQVRLDAEKTDPQGSELSRSGAPKPRSSRLARLVLQRVQIVLGGPGRAAVE